MSILKDSLLSSVKELDTKTPLPLFKDQTEKSTQETPSLRFAPSQKLSLSQIQSQSKLRTSLKLLIQTAVKTISQDSTRTLIQIGISGHVGELNQTADYLTRVEERTIYAVDDFHEDSSILNGDFLVAPAHKRTPPSIHNRVKIWEEVQDLKQDIGWLYITRGDIGDLEVLRAGITKDTVIVAPFALLNDITERWQIEMVPQLYYDDWIAVKVC